MRTFKQFKVGDMNYKLSFDKFTDCNPDSGNRMYLRIDGVSGRHIIARVDPYKRWIVYKPSHLNGPVYHTEILENNKAQEVRRLIMLFLTNQL